MMNGVSRSYAPTSTNQVFERAVEEEMKKQLAAIRKSREYESRKPPLPVARGSFDLSKNRNNPMAIGFGRGLQQLHSDDLQERRLEDLNKKLSYQKELDRQLFEKKLLQKRQETEKANYNIQTKKNVKPVQRDIERKKQQEYKYILEQQIKEREQQKLKELQIETIIPESKELQIGSIIPDVKHTNQQIVQTMLREQINERKLRQQEERRKRDEQEAADEARIQRERLELRLAYEKERELSKIKNDEARRSQQRSTALHQEKPPSNRKNTPQRRNSVSHSVSRTTSSIDNSRSNRLSNTKGSEILEDLDAKRKEMSAMREQQMYLERQIEIQRSELERLHMLKVTPERRKSVHIGSESGEFHRSGRRRGSFGSVESSSSSAMPPRPPRAESVESWAAYPYEPMRKHCDLEQSMVSQSTLISHYPSSEGWNKPHISESPNLQQQHKGILQPVPESQGIDLVSCQASDVFERSLPIASRYFVYVAEKRIDVDRAPTEPKSIPVSPSPLKTPVPDALNNSMIDEMEKSRVRTAQAARLALERAISDSDDDDDSLAMSDTQTSSCDSDKAKTHSYCSIETEISIDNGVENEIDQGNRWKISSDKHQDKTNNRFQVNTVGESKNSRFLVHTPNRSSMINMD